ncbi:DUF2550 domain-containing protein [Streptomyces thinghirensis]|nr:DUF2550 domain-containing protein [Streptomyces thinghirensis]
MVIGLFVFGLRRRLIQRSGGTFDCSLRWDAPKEGDGAGKGWSYGVASLQRRPGRVSTASSSYSPARAACWSALRDRGGRPPRPGRRGGAGRCSDAVVLACLHRGTRLELAMSEDALTGLLAWLEAASPGQRVKCGVATFTRWVGSPGRSLGSVNVA